MNNLGVYEVRVSFIHEVAVELAASIDADSEEAMHFVVQKVRNGDLPNLRDDDGTIRAVECQGVTPAISVKLMSYCIKEEGSGLAVWGQGSGVSREYDLISGTIME